MTAATLPRSTVDLRRIWDDAPHLMIVALMLISGDGSFEVAGGNLHVRKSADARTLEGKVSLNTGDEEVVRLERTR